MLKNTNTLVADTGYVSPEVRKKIREEAGTPTAAETAKSSAARSAAAATAPSTVQVERPEDAESEYERLLREAQGYAQAPAYTDAYKDKIDALYEQITGRGSFSYDLDADALYQQYADKYIQQGKQAMIDTMGRAAALTGGYGSSYGQAAGQQQYNQYLQQLGDIVPELYESAYSKWQDEGNRLLDQYGMLSDLADKDYSRYQDAYNQWLTERSYTESKAQSALDQQSENLSMLQYLMSIGYTPTAQEIADAGLTPDQYVAMKKYLLEQGVS